MLQRRSTFLIQLLTASFLVAINTTNLRAEPPLPDSGTLSSDDLLIDPFDPFDLGDKDPITSEKEDASKSAEALLREASNLLMLERPLDARTKLLRALQKDPKLYRTHYLLAGYYLVHVGHFRLAMKYIKQAEKLFEEQNGKPPYYDQMLKVEHSSLLYYESQIRLSLDNYQGALESLDRYSAHGYSSEWYPGSRAWILMKLGRIQEAITVARAGILAGAEPGRTLNMLGILLSMNGQPQEALDVFRKAIANEFASGSDGQPATPLNNSGEVYKELFEDDKAESSFLRAISLPDGCEHVLPSLNMALMYIDQLKLESARSTIDGFDRCVAQFPLRNNEEHAALVQLARGRIALHSGDIDTAIKLLRSSMDGTQWFGKIGTNQNDLVVAATISLSQALTIKNNHLRLHISESWPDTLNNIKERASNSLEAWWLMRRARQMLVGELNDLEDLQIRNTDSLLEYPTLGDALKGLSTASLSKRLRKERENDLRSPAKLFYELYGAQSHLGIWRAGEANKTLDEVIERARPRYDELLKTHATLLRMRTIPRSQRRYRDLAYRVFFTAPALLRNYGLPLPVSINSSKVSKDTEATLLKGPFIKINGDDDTACAISESRSEGGFKLYFTCPAQSAKNRVVEDSALERVVNKMAEAVYLKTVVKADQNGVAG